ncbi:hypothetical protein TcG_08189 [Trypanosoma cruzi]|uniref:RING-type domain-containing protein n=2 Tax=Trypanosoma cruzi TaxID=5693 RepID=V5BCN0_TRYCR|nr:hypothetical protein TCDM_14501 [Trypanosoma cruzi Dm28c]PBJ75878.1 hypothetical protein BCY84_10580 [Trypanosoma cruzi cruzi]PWU93429.1 hypothetical protein C4B63_31g1443c [Trypanosoma cruzi]RNF13815.1 hypothetical protein TcG_08189 [Trypanosoma cruzi]
MTSTSTDAERECSIPVIMKEAFLFFAYEHPVIGSLECLVCKLHLEECCLGCRGKGNPIEECHVVRGTCDHTFHDHCIQSWCRQRRECPACFKEWVPATYVQRT